MAKRKAQGVHRGLGDDVGGRSKDQVRDIGQPQAEGLGEEEGSIGREDGGTEIEIRIRNRLEFGSQIFGSDYGLDLSSDYSFQILIVCLLTTICREGGQSDLGLMEDEGAALAGRETEVWDGDRLE